MTERLLEHVPGSVVELCGKKYLVKATSFHMCVLCALNGSVNGEEARKVCKMVQCSPFHRRDRTRVYYVEVEGEQE